MLSAQKKVLSLRTLLDLKSALNCSKTRYGIQPSGYDLETKNNILTVPIPQEELPLRLADPSDAEGYSELMLLISNEFLSDSLKNIGLRFMLRGAERNAAYDGCRYMLNIALNVVEEWLTRRN
jgi:hypothetical protein